MPEIAQDPKVKFLNPTRGPAVVEVECSHEMRRRTESDSVTATAIFKALRVLVFACPRCAFEAEGFIEPGNEFTVPGDVGATP